MNLEYLEHDAWERKGTYLAEDGSTIKVKTESRDVATNRLWYRGLPPPRIAIADLYVAPSLPVREGDYSRFTPDELQPPA